MRTTSIRQRLHDYVDTAEGKKLKTIYTLSGNELSDVQGLSVAQKKELDKRFSGA